MRENPSVALPKTFIARDVHPTVVRLHPELREQLQQLAQAHGLSLSKEISQRLERSLELERFQKDHPQHVPPSYGGPGPQAPRVAREWQDVEPPISDTDRAMLDVFRRLPPEKQLALLSLFK